MDSNSSAWYVYILECRNGSFYVGISQDVAKRFIMHQQSHGAEFTKRFQPVKISWQEVHDSIGSARQREIQLKGWSRKKKQQLISGII